MTKIAWHIEAWNEFLEWQANDKRIFEKIKKLLKQCVRTPFEGDGNPEPLKHELAGFWSRRINSKDRLVYRVSGDTLEVIQCKTHYGKE